MKIIPAIDLLGGECVRLEQGNFMEVSVYQKDPVSIARQFEQAGATRIHIVDLDAAQGNRGVNYKKIRSIRKSVSCKLQVGGGIRDERDIEELLDLGIDNIVLGTVFAKKPMLVQGWIAHFGDIFYAAIDAREGKVHISGWRKATNITDIELAQKAKSIGIIGIIYTNIAHDGMLQGPDVERTNEVAKNAQLPVILSGGIGTEEDIKKVMENGHQNVKGIVLGKAIYEKNIDLTHTIKKYQNNTIDNW